MSTQTTALSNDYYRGLLVGKYGYSIHEEAQNLKQLYVVLTSSPSPEVAAVSLCIEGCPVSSLLILAESGVDLSHSDDLCFRSAVCGEHIDLILFFQTQEKVNVNALDGAALRDCIIFRDQSTLRALLEDVRIDPDLIKEAPLISAMRNNREGNFQVLLKDDRIDPTTDDNAALKFAMTQGNPFYFDVLCKHQKVKETPLGAGFRSAVKLPAHFLFDQINDLGESAYVRKLMLNWVLRAVVISGREGSMTHLLKNGASPSAANYDSIVVAALKKNDFVLNALLSQARKLSKGDPLIKEFLLHNEIFRMEFESAGGDFSVIEKAFAKEPTKASAKEPAKEPASAKEEEPAKEEVHPKTPNEAQSRGILARDRLEEKLQKIMASPTIMANLRDVAAMCGRNSLQTTTPFLIGLAYGMVIDDCL